MPACPVVARGGLPGMPDRRVEVEREQLQPPVLVGTSASCEATGSGGSPNDCQRVQKSLPGAVCQACHTPPLPTNASRRPSAFRATAGALKEVWSDGSDRLSQLLLVRRQRVTGASLESSSRAVAIPSKNPRWFLATAILFPIDMADHPPLRLDRLYLLPPGSVAKARLISSEPMRT